MNPHPFIRLGQVKEIALFATVWRCWLKAIDWSGCSDLVMFIGLGHIYTHLFHCCTIITFEHDFAIVKWPLEGRHSFIENSFILMEPILSK